MSVIGSFSQDVGISRQNISVFTSENFIDGVAIYSNNTNFQTAGNYMNIAFNIASGDSISFEEIYLGVQPISTGAGNNLLANALTDDLGFLTQRMQILHQIYVNLAQAAQLQIFSGADTAFIINETTAAVAGQILNLALTCNSVFFKYNRSYTNNTSAAVTINIQLASISSANAQNATPKTTIVVKYRGLGLSGSSIVYSNVGGGAGGGTTGGGGFNKGL